MQMQMIQELRGLPRDRHVRVENAEVENDLCRLLQDRIIQL